MVLVEISQEAMALFEKEFNVSFEEGYKKLLSYKDKFRAEMIHMSVDCLCGYMNRSYILCYGKDAFKKDYHVSLMLKELELDPMIKAERINEYYFFSGRNDKLIEEMKKQFANASVFDDEFTENEAVAYWINVFGFYKNAFHGFWKALAEGYESIGDKISAELSLFAEELYERIEANKNVIEYVLEFKSSHPTYKFLDEILARLYWGNGLWYNAISYYESVYDSSMVFAPADISFDLAWAYGKVREYKEEEACYRDCLAEQNNYWYALNNLGYCLMRQKKYEEAEEIFLQCIAEERDLPQSANNLVEVYLKQGKNKEAHDFADSGKYKISKTILKKLAEKPYKNESVCKIETITEISDDNMAQSISRSSFKAEQFSNEKILEDEIMARLEAGNEIFGMSLKVYRKKGDYYGRQYICNDGKMRLDILCEDSKGNFVIIELKKDSGYDDPYQQITDYISWFDKNMTPKGKKTYGIICLNSPSEELKKKVRSNELVKLFEYKISYNEII